MTSSDKPFTGPGGADEKPPTPTPEEEAIAAAKAADRFDIRRLIGGLFLLYGVTLTIVGIVGTSHVKNKAAGINVDLWTGIGMVVFAVLMIVWALSRPVSRQFTPGEGSGRLRRAPA
jgi:hypothetical protein